MLVNVEKRIQMTATSNISQNYFPSLPIPHIGILCYFIDLYNDIIHCYFAPVYTTAFRNSVIFVWFPAGDLLIILRTVFDMTSSAKGSAWSARVDTREL